MKNKITPFLIIGLVVVAGIFYVVNNSAPIQAGTKEEVPIIGFIDIAEVSKAHPQRQVKQEELNNKTAEYKEIMEEQIKDKTREEINQIIEEYNNKLNELKKEYEAWIISTIDEALREVASELEVEVVLDKRVVLYGGFDLTEAVKNRVIEKYGTN